MRYATILMPFRSTAAWHGTAAQNFRETASSKIPLHASTSANFARGLLIGVLLSTGLFWLPLGALITFLIRS